MWSWTTTAWAEAELLQNLHSRSAERAALLEECSATGDSRKSDLSAILNDAIHVAAAVVSDQDVLLSWNVKHVVNRHRRAEIDALNASAGLRTLEILAPSEI